MQHEGELANSRFTYLFYSTIGQHTLHCVRRSEIKEMKRWYYAAQCKVWCRVKVVVHICPYSTAAAPMFVQKAWTGNETTV